MLSNEAYLSSSLSSSRCAAWHRLKSSTDRKRKSLLPKLGELDFKQYINNVYKLKRDDGERVRDGGEGILQRIYQNEVFKILVLSRL